MMTATPRRGLATRDASWARHLAAALARAGARPNTVSLVSILCACGGFTAFTLVPLWPAGRTGLFIAAAAATQLRLLCNLLDGMLAVEQGLHTATGALYNEVPDRVADVVLLVGAGCSVRDLTGGVPLGAAAAMLAVFTAYVRVLGGSLGTTQYFSGPMAKQHRMFALTCGAIGSAAETAYGAHAEAMIAALAAIVAGTVVTARRRIVSIARELEQR